MGFQFYVCQKCGQLNSESDLGDHQKKCTKPQISKEVEQLENDIEEEFGDDYRISEKMLSYFHSFAENLFTPKVHVNG